MTDPGRFYLVWTLRPYAVTAAHVFRDMPSPNFAKRPGTRTRALLVFRGPIAEYVRVLRTSTFHVDAVVVIVVPTWQPSRDFTGKKWRQKRRSHRRPWLDRGMTQIGVLRVMYQVCTVQCKESNGPGVTYHPTLPLDATLLVDG